MDALTPAIATFIPHSLNFVPAVSIPEEEAPYLDQILDNWQQTGLMFAAAISISGCAAAFFSSALISCAAWGIVGLACLIGAYYLRDYQLHLRLSKTVPRLEEVNQQLEHQIARQDGMLSEFRHNLTSLTKSDQLIKERIERFEEANQKFIDISNKLATTTANLTHVEEKLLERTNTSLEIEKRILQGTCKLEEVETKIINAVEQLGKNVNNMTDATNGAVNLLRCPSAAPKADSAMTDDPLEAVQKSTDTDFSTGS